MNKTQVREYRQLQDSGVHVSEENVIKPNSGSETLIHLLAKDCVAKIGLTQGYRIDSEVEVWQGSECIGEVDVLLWGLDDRQSYAVELEHSPLPEVVESKVDRYVRTTEIDDLLLVNLNKVPHDIHEAKAEIAEQMGIGL